MRTDTYYADQEVFAHLCPFCTDYVLEAPATWPKAEIEEILGAHVKECLVIGDPGEALRVRFTP